jgi:hypothetical protein
MTIVGIKLDETVEHAAHVALTALCESHHDADHVVLDTRAGGAHVEAASSKRD